ncbi:MAG: YjbQ family protein [Candidatus Dadabacteria bacterium]|nr:YjbQ family protein [Candidatus Dadabacteria bacterium]NIS07937.1 YjbQ family protein [Candidatus Dadabacteria bacterium]NIY21521.1 YjbQ family protein [Candidatus Dadabacteria bacterium]
MTWIQKEISLSPKPRGFHIVTGEILKKIPQLSDFKVGIAHISICHTSASLTLNENVSPDVLTDFESSFNNIVPENEPYYRHTLEGSDDMPAHIKSSLLGSSITVPVTKGRFNLGTWQGIYLCEHRNRGGSRKLIITIHGETDEK